MVRIVYRWRVQKTNVSKFRTNWAKATKAIRTSTPGARGSVLLQSHKDETEFITIARWDTLENWQSFWLNHTNGEMREMHALAQRLSVDVYDEIEDHTI